MIPLTMSVTIEIPGQDDIYIDVAKMSEVHESATMYSANGNSINYNCEIYNHEGTQLELLEKIINGWNLSRENQV